MRALFVTCCPGSAETFGRVSRRMQRNGHSIQFLAMGMPASDTKLRYFGSGNVLDALGVDHIDLLAHHEAARLEPDACELAEEILEKSTADVLFSGTCRDPTGRYRTIEDAISDLAARSGLRTIRFVDSWNVWFPRAYEMHEPDVYAVPDRMTEKIMCRRGGADAQRIVVTGSPAWDDFAFANSTKRNRSASHKGRVHAYFGNVSENDRMALQWIVGTLDNKDHLLFKRHPRDNRNYADLTGIPASRVHETNEESDDLVRRADVCLGYPGAMLVKAALIGVPVITFHSPQMPDELHALLGASPLTYMGASVDVSTEHELRRALTSELPTCETKSSLNVDGGAVDRLISLARSDKM